MPFEKGHKLATGRPQGSQNKVSVEIREMVRQALDEAGGVEYLKQQAIDNPGPFMSLIAKIIPNDVKITMALPEARAYPLGPPTIENDEQHRLSTTSETVDGIH